jgi:hypothetical protein
MIVEDSVQDIFRGQIHQFIGFGGDRFSVRTSLGMMSSGVWYCSSHPGLEKCHRYGFESRLRDRRSCSFCYRSSQELGVNLDPGQVVLIGMAQIEILPEIHDAIGIHGCLSRMNSLYCSPLWGFREFFIYVAQFLEAESSADLS